MRDLANLSNPYADDKVINACSIFGVMDRTGSGYPGSKVLRAIANMHDRGNGLGGGFAAYGIYPDRKDFFALHIMFLTSESKRQVETFLEENFNIAHAEEIPTRQHPAIVNPPLVHRYFVLPRVTNITDGKSQEDFVVEKVMVINTKIDGAFVFSSGKNMGVFKGVGFPEDVGQYFCLGDYDAYIWSAHGRFPTNTQAWWGGAHPFCILDWTVIHNGEISSYGINRRFLESYGYFCTMFTDTEVIAYTVDLLIRRHGLTIETAAKVMAAPLWSHIDRMPPEDKELCTRLRQVYGSLLLNGPFTVVIAHNGEMIGLTDRIRLRPLTVGEKGDLLFLSSEEAAIRLVCPDLEDAWIPVGGVPVVGRLGERAVRAEKVAAAG